MSTDLLELYDAELRGRVPDTLPAGAELDRDGPLFRFRNFFGPSSGFVGYRDLDGLGGDEVDALIARQVAFFGERGERFEWKLHGHDRPPDLAVVIARVAEIAGEPVLPPEVALREVTGRADLERIAEMQASVWHDDHTWVVEALGAERAADPSGLTIVVAEAGGEVVCAAWIRFEHGTSFATLWGGATLPAWRSRGIYRATVTHRANLAAARGFELLQVDASDDSRPILERLGFVAVTTTTPYIWSPPTR
jgi:GNAT superfamily N-acetyltransferase